MNKEFRLPDVGEGLTEADIVSWHVKPGDTVTINQVIVEIETAKAVVELPSPYAGTVSALLVAEGQTVDVGIPIITIDVPVAGEAPAADAAPAKAEAEGRRGSAAGRSGSASPARPPAGPRRVRRQAGLDQPPGEKGRADPTGFLSRPRLQGRPGGRAGAPHARSRWGGSPPMEDGRRAAWRRPGPGPATPGDEQGARQASGATARPGPRHRPHRANGQRA